jgi:uroporphyrin-III C-methyltransferase
LVGAGPEIHLLTIKGQKHWLKMLFYMMLWLMKSCCLAPKKALKIFVGKERGHAYSQDEINQLIVDNALTYNVVRLKR